MPVPMHAALYRQRVAQQRLGLVVLQLILQGSPPAPGLRTGVAFGARVLVVIRPCAHGFRSEGRRLLSCVGDKAAKRPDKDCCAQCYS